MSYESEFRRPCDMPKKKKKKKKSSWSQVSLKYLTNFVRCHVNGNKMMTCVTQNKKN